MNVSMTTGIIMLWGILGMIMGSFLNCAAERIVRGESILKIPSHCLHCGHRLAAKDLIPVISWCRLHGRCRYCGKKIPAQLLMAELAGALLYLSLFLKYGWSTDLLQWIALGSVCLCIACCDSCDMIIPNPLILTGILIRIGFILFFENDGSLLLTGLLNSSAIVLPLLIIALWMSRRMKKPVMGGGDLKLVGMLGLYFSWPVNLMGLMSASVVGLIIALILHKQKGAVFPFGPALCLGWWMAALFGQEIVDRYLRLF